MKIVTNICYGGFYLTDEFKEKYPAFNDYTERDDPNFIKALEEFGLDKAASLHSAFKITELDDNITTDWDINEYDGSETIVYVQNGKINYC